MWQNLISLPGPWRVECPHTSVTSGGDHDAPSHLAADHFGPRFSLAPLTAEAQPAPPVYRIGRLISGNPPAGPDLNLEAFRQGLRDLGYVEGQNLALESRYV